MTRWDGPRGSREPHLLGPNPAQNVPTLHADQAVPNRKGDAGSRSATQTQSVDKRAVALYIDLGHVLEQTPPPADQ